MYNMNISGSVNFSAQPCSVELSPTQSLSNLNQKFIG